MSKGNFKISKLSEDFYNTYPNPPFTEILEKHKRAYVCLLFRFSDNCFIAIPFRSNISHRYAYHFKSSIRSTEHNSGLDYTKIIVINNPIFLSNINIAVDKDEFNETIKNIDKIHKEALKFVNDYINHINGSKLLHKSEFNRRYLFSPLKYFHTELGIK